MFNCIKKYLKKRRLLKKYELTKEKMLNQIHLFKLMEDDKEFFDFYRHRIYCELRFVKRIKQL